jgi:hypothetical protein
MTEKIDYQERLSSNRTLALFAVLTLLSSLVAAWRVSTARLDGWAVFFLCFGIFFLFYTINYRTLIIQITSETLKLRFGIFAWTVPVANIANCELDVLPAFKRDGGAGIHFMFAGKRYRASFNFLEYERVRVAFKRKVGLVQEISFSTRRPDEVVQRVREAISASRVGVNTSPVA